MDDTHEPRHSTYYATNRRNIDQLHENRDRAGLIQMIDVLTLVTGWRAHDAARLIDDARTAIDGIAATSPRTLHLGDPGIRVGDILEYDVRGEPRSAIVLIVTDCLAVTHLGDELPLS
ncbi:hypothetical protein [Microbacterium sp. MMO-56]|uniref:hypothetical protein n=1 Tax=Microbacterium sp. MMO-56 TaxID=3081281 RepID=UPI003016EE69